MKIVLLDDDPAFLAEISEQLLKTSHEIFQSSIETYTTSHDIKEPYQADIYILDIDLPAENGFEVAERITRFSSKSKIVFCTSHEDLVFQSYNLNAFFFIRKNHLSSDLSLMLKKYLRLQNSSSYHIFQNTIVTKSIPYEEILCISTYGNSVIIHCLHHEDLIDHRSLKSAASSLPITRFALASSSAIIQLGGIKKIEKDIVILSDGSHIHASRAKLKDLKEAYSTFLLENI